MVKLNRKGWLVMDKEDPRVRVFGYLVQRNTVPINFSNEISSMEMLSLDTFNEISIVTDNKIIIK